MSEKENNLLIKPKEGVLFERVASILEQAKSNVVQVVNSNMVLAYWSIGREIVYEIQQGEERAEYGKKIIEELSQELTQAYGKGFSLTNLRYFRLFYQVYADREPVIRHKACDEFKNEEEIHHKPCDILADLNLAIEKTNEIQGFSPSLSWSHYRTMTKVEHKNERLFYEIEAEKERWSVPHLERQINTFLFSRLLKSEDKAGVMDLAQKGLTVNKPADIIKSSYVLDFLGLPESENSMNHKLNKQSSTISKAFYWNSAKALLLCHGKNGSPPKPKSFILIWFSTIII